MADITSLLYLNSLDKYRHKLTYYQIPNRPESISSEVIVARTDLNQYLKHLLQLDNLIELHNLKFGRFHDVSQENDIVALKPDYIYSGWTGRMPNLHSALILYSSC